MEPLPLSSPTPPSVQPDATSATLSTGAPVAPESYAGPTFAFEKTFICPRCNRPLALYLQPVHLEVTVNCPRCSRPLTSLIRGAIREHLAHH